MSTKSRGSSEHFPDTRVQQHHKDKTVSAREHQQRVQESYSPQPWHDYDDDEDEDDGNDNNACNDSRGSVKVEPNEEFNCEATTSTCFRAG